MLGGSLEEGKGGEGQVEGGGTYPSPAARTCSCRRCLPAPTPRGRTGSETPGTRFHEPCQPLPKKTQTNPQASGIPIDVKRFPSRTQLREDGEKQSEGSLILPGADCGRSASVQSLAWRELGVRRRRRQQRARDVFSLSAFVSPSPPLLSVSGLLRGYWASLRSASPALRGCL